MSFSFITWKDTLDINLYSFLAIWNHIGHETFRIVPIASKDNKRGHSRDRAGTEYTAFWGYYGDKCNPTRRNNTINRRLWPEMTEFCWEEHSAVMEGVESFVGRSSTYQKRLKDYRFILNCPGVHMFCGCNICVRYWKSLAGVEFGFPGCSFLIQQHV